MTCDAFSLARIRSLYEEASASKCLDDDFGRTIVGCSTSRFDSPIGNRLLMKISYQIVLRPKSGLEHRIFQDTDKDLITSPYLTFVERHTGFDRFHLWQRYLFYMSAPLLAWQLTTGDTISQR